MHHVIFSELTRVACRLLGYSQQEMWLFCQNLVTPTIYTHYIIINKNALLQTYLANYFCSTMVLVLVNFFSLGKNFSLDSRPLYSQLEDVCICIRQSHTFPSNLSKPHFSSKPHFFDVYIRIRQSHTFSI